jgi:hypothetical protein
MWMCQIWRKNKIPFIFRLFKKLLINNSKSICYSSSHGEFWMISVVNFNLSPFLSAHLYAAIMIRGGWPETVRQLF